MRFSILLSLLSVALGETVRGVEPKGSICGKATDPCMNDENWKECKELEESGCQSVLVMESCPLQFACNKEAKEVEEETAKIVNCVTLSVYKDTTCSGDPLRELVFPTSDKPGLPCYHDAAMPGYSVKDQYCDGGFFQQTVYPGSDKCEVAWWQQLWSPDTQIFTKGTCLYGIKFASCDPGPCDSDKEGSVGDVVAMFNTN